MFVFLFTDIRYQCLGTWVVTQKTGQVYTYATIANVVENDPREKYKCLVWGVLFLWVLHRFL